MILKPSATLGLRRGGGHWQTNKCIGNTLYVLAIHFLCIWNTYSVFGIHKVYSICLACSSEIGEKPSQRLAATFIKAFSLISDNKKMSNRTFLYGMPSILPPFFAPNPVSFCFVMGNLHMCTLSSSYHIRSLCEHGLWVCLSSYSS